MIAFVSYRNGKAHLWIMNSNGTDPINLTPDFGNFSALNSEWSPDGQQILFRVDSPEGRMSLWVVSIDNKNLQNLTADIENDVGNAHWSPNGKWIVFNIFESLYTSSIWLMNSDGKPRRKLLSGDQNYAPQWSPDGKSISYRSGYGDHAQLILWDIETDKTRTLLTNEILDYAWAPKSNLIIYLVPKSNEPIFQDVWLLQIDTLNKTKLTEKPLILNSEIAWSPNEEKIAFRSSCQSNVDIVILILKQKSFINPTSCKQDINGFASWFPDSEHMLLQSYRSGKASIWVMSSDGKEAVDLINRAN